MVVDIRTSRRIPQWLGPLLIGGLAVTLLSVYAPGDWRNGDVALYHIYALGFWGALAHPLLPTEYPPLAILPFGLSMLGPTTWYPDVFAFWMAFAATLGYLAFRRWTTPHQANAYAVYVLAAGIATLLFRYDIVPALLTVSAVWLVQRRHFAAVYPLLAIATLLKLYPLVLLPVVVIAQWRARNGSGPQALWGISIAVASFGAIVALGFIAAVTVDPAHGLSAITYDLQRPDEVESVPATGLWFASAAGFATSADWGFGSFNLTSSLSPLVNALADGALLLGLAWVYWRQLRGQVSVGQAAVGVVLVLLCTNKVLSAQYLIWLAPLLAATAGFQVRWLFVCLLTALIFPAAFETGIAHDGATVTYSGFLLAAIAARNSLLVVLTARFLLVPGIDQQLAPPLGSRVAASPRAKFA